MAESEAGSGLERLASRWIALLISSGRLEAAAAACDAFLFRMPLEGGAMLLAFRVAATRFADIRRAMLKEVYVTVGAVKRRRRGGKKYD